MFLSVANNLAAPDRAVVVTPLFALIAAIGGVVVTGLFASAREADQPRDSRS